MGVNVGKSAKLYQERRLPQDRNTRRRPGMRSDMSRNQVHFLPLAPPLPTPEVLQDEDNQPPDAGRTKPWPHGDKERF